MSDFFGEHRVTVHGESVGTVRVTREGLMTAVEGEISLLSDDILRLGAVSGDETVPIGVLVPKNSGLYVKKRYSAAGLKASHLGGDCRFVILGMEEKAKADEPIPPETEEEPEVLPDGEETGGGSDVPPEELLPEEYRGISGAQVYAEGDIVFLAVPISGGEFPLMHILMCGRAERIDGEDYVVFAFQNGELVESFQQSPGNPS